MEQKHKDFILNELIPFIKRHEGRNFAMDTWLEKFAVGEERYLDDVARVIPKDCGTASCIGGSIEALKCNGWRGMQEEEVMAALGLSYMRAYGLFYNWSANDDDLESEHAWPKNFRQCFAKAKDAKCKAEVACALLEKVVETEGACLDPGWEEGE